MGKGTRFVGGFLTGVLLLTPSVVVLGDGPGLGSKSGQGGTTSGQFPTAQVPAAVSGGFTYAGPPYFVTVGADGRPLIVSPPLIAPSAVLVPVAVPVGAGLPLGGPMPPRPMIAQAPAPARAGARRIDRDKSEVLVTIGDRLFRARNTKRAAERYEQAARANPDDATPLVRMAQLALARADYAEAASHLRRAVDTDPVWLTRAPNIVSVYGEPRDFDQVIAKLESHLLLEPGDRDGWFVLGAQLYLAGQTRRAGDVFTRLTDRRADSSLQAFLDATRSKTR